MGVFKNKIVFILLCIFFVLSGCETKQLLNKALFILIITGLLSKLQSISLMLRIQQLPIKYFLSSDITMLTIIKIFG